MGVIDEVDSVDFSSTLKSSGQQNPQQQQKLVKTIVPRKQSNDQQKQIPKQTYMDDEDANVEEEVESGHESKK